MSTRIAILDDYQGVARRYADWESLPDDCTVHVFREHIAETATLIAALREFDVVVAMRERTAFTAERLAALPRLRLLVTTGMANASIDMAAARERGITVCGTSGDSRATSELAWGLILSLARSIPAEDARLRAGGWQRTIGVELQGRTLGLVGLGNQGAAMVPVARAFGMGVIAWSQHLTAERAAQVGVEAVARDELFRRADFVSVHYKLGPRSVGLVGAAELALMQPTAYLINTSRGPIVDGRALLEALHAGRIAGAGLDVYDTEPLLADDPFRSAPRTVLTPHLGYVSDRAYRAMYPQAVEDIAGFLRGEPVRVIAAP
jgi:phosphoglycerate dehydrogenase-like enzyme